MTARYYTLAQFKKRYQRSHTATFCQDKTERLVFAKISAPTRIHLADAESWAASLPVRTGGAA